MLVENWVENFTAEHGIKGLKRRDATISQRAHKRLCREAADYIGGYGLDFTQLDGPVLVFHDMINCAATWTHKTTKQEVELTHIWFDHKTGEITQAGANYERLSL